jgi:hypothetical protein
MEIIINIHGDEDIWVIKIDSLGNILQQTTVGTNNSEGANNALQTHDNNFLIAGILTKYVTSNISNIFIVH